MPTKVDVKLPKVAKYIMNVGSSVKLAAIDYMGEVTPGVADFLETNNELFKEIYSSTVHYKETIKKVNRAFKASKIYSAVDDAKKSLIEDLKTGNFYNKEREESLGMKGLDLEVDDDMDFDPSMFDFSDDDTSDAAKQSRAFDRAIEASTKAQADIIVRTGDVIAGTVRASNSMLYTQNERLLSTVSSGMANVHAAVSGLGKYLEGPMMTHLQNTKTYQENSIKYQEQITKQLEEILQMQRNLYAAESEAYNGNKNKAPGLEDIIGYEGSPNLMEYGKRIYKNFKDFAGPEFDMLFGDSFGKNSNPLLMLAGAPLKFIPEYIVKKVIPDTVKGMMETLDKTISGVFTTMISRLNFAASDDSDASPLFKILGRIFGIEVKRNTTVDVSKFKKGPIPFDGVTKQAIVEVIPSYLSRIESLLTGNSERIYNMQNGTWTDIRAIEKAFKDRQEAAVSGSIADIRKPVDEYINSLKNATYTNNKEKEKAEEEIKKLNQALYDLSHKIYKEGGNFKGYKPTYDSVTESYQSAWDDSDIDKDVYLKLMDLLSSPNNRGNMTHLAQETMRQISSFNDYIRQATDEYGPIVKLFNKGYKVNTSYGSVFDPDKPDSDITGYKPIINTVGSKLVSAITEATDADNKNIFFYLRGIYGVLLADFKNGGRRRKRKGNRSDSTNNGISPEDALNMALAASIPTPSSSSSGDADEQDGNSSNADNPDGITFEEAANRFDLDRYIDENYRDNTPSPTSDSFITQFKRAVGIGEKFKATRDAFNALMDEPGKILVKWMKAADLKVYQLLFGTKEMSDVERRFGDRHGGIVEHLIYRIEESFDKLDDWVADHLLTPIKKWLDETGITDKFNKVKDKAKELFHWEDIKASFANKFNFGKNQVTGAFRTVADDISNSSVGNTTRYAYYQTVNSGHNRVSDRDEDLRRSRPDGTPRVEKDWSTNLKRGVYETVLQLARERMKETGESFEESLQYIVHSGIISESDYDRPADTAASGKFITKRGLAIVSPGETIIPATFDKKTQMKQLAKEKAYANRFNIKTADYYAEGTVGDADSDSGLAESIPAEDEGKVKKAIKQVARELSPGENIIDIAVNSLIGGGVSLITGMVGGPLLGAAAGAGIGIIKNSQTVKDMLFGTEFKEGMVSKDFQQKFSKYFPDMKNYGIVGSIAGLFTPFGLLGGLLAGGAIGFLKNNDEFQEFIFGPKNRDGERDNGLITKEFRERVAKAAPRMLLGAAGGALLGPFGLLPNAILGSALGFVTTTDSFHDAIFGEDDGTGNRKGGLINNIKDYILGKKDANGKRVGGLLGKLRNFTDPTIQMIKNGINNIVNGIKDSIDSKVVTPIRDFLEHKIFDRVKNLFGKIIKAPIALAKGLISAPFNALQFVGNNIRSSQIAKGTASNMTAAQRVQWRKDHSGRRTLNNMLARDKFARMDNILATQYEGDKGLDRLKEDRDNLALFFTSRKEFNSRCAKLLSSLIKAISDILNEPYDHPSLGMVIPYSVIGYKSVSRVNKLIAKGNIEEAISEISSGKFKEFPEIVQRCIDKINELAPEVQKAIDQKNNMDKHNNAILKQMSKATGWRIRSRKDMRALKNLYDKEIDTRETIAAERKDAELREAVANEQTDRLINSMKEQHEKTVDILRQIRDGIFTISGKEEENTYRAEEEEAARIAEEEEIANEEAAEENSRGLGSRLEDFIENTKTDFSDAYDTVSRARRNFGRFRRTAGFQVGKYFDKKINKIKEGFSTNFRAGMAEADEEYKNKKKRGRDDTSEDSEDATQNNPNFTSDDNVTSVGGIITGEKSDVIEMVNNGYRITEDGGLEDSDGNLLSTDNRDEILRQREKDKEANNEANNTLKGMATTLISGFTHFLGYGWQRVKNAKKSFLDNINDLLETSIVGKVIRGVFGIGKGLIVMSMFGHVAKFWTNSIWNPIIKPFWNETLKPALADIGSNVFNFIKEKWPGVADTLIDLKDKVVDFFKDPVTTLGNLFFDGLKAFWDYVAEPLGTLLWNAIHKPTFNDFLTSSRTTDKKEYNVTDENGNNIYIDSEGNRTTEAYDANGNANEALTKSINVTTKKKRTGILSLGGIVNYVTNGFKALQYEKSVTYDGSKYTLEKYSNGLIVIRNETTGDFAKFTEGSDKISFGCKTDKDGQPSAASVIGTTIGLGAIGHLSVAGMIAAGAVSGSVVPGVGTVIGAVVGLAGSLIIYNMENGKDYKTEIALKYPEDAAKITICLAELGWIGGTDAIDNWPQFPESLNSDNKNSAFDSQYTESSSSGSQTSTNSGSARTSTRTINQGKSEALSGTGHIYQKAKDIADQKFGNSTIGEAGCGPVAATNLINKLGGNMDLNTAASYAESGGFIDNSTGGTSTTYMNSILNKSGIPSVETTNKNDIYKNLRNGNPVVMLGNSGYENGTPFGSNDHYITAMGMDRNGNIIAEDPDLPDSYRKYKASRVLNDMDVGIATGMGRYYNGNKRPGKLPRFGRGKNPFTQMHEDAYNNKSTIMPTFINTMQISDINTPAIITDSKFATKVYNWAFRCADCFADAESSNNYAAVSKNDSGAGLSIGRYQFHRGRAKALLGDILNALISDGIYTIEGLRNLMGNKLYAFASYEDSSNTYYPNNTEAEIIAKLLDTEQGHECQDRKMVHDIETLYWPHIEKLGLDIAKQEDIIIYLCSPLHVAGESSGLAISKRVLNSATNATSKTISGLTLDDIHNAMMNDAHGREYKSRYDKHYKYLTHTDPAGNNSSYWNDIASNNDNQFSNNYSNIMEEVHNENASKQPNFLTALADIANAVMTKIYGEKLMRIFGGTSSSTGSSGSLYSPSSSGSPQTISGGSVTTSSFNANSAQKALPAWLKSIEGKIAYSDVGVQDPDQGTASCASTVEWAYKKALGLGDMPDVAYAQMNHNLNNGFSYVYKSDTPASAYNGSDFSMTTDLPKLQAGDILYYRTKKAADPLDLNRPMGIGHVEMYDGEGHRIGHGDINKKGPSFKSIDSNHKNLVAALRYNKFINGEKPEFYNPDGTKGVYPVAKSKLGANAPGAPVMYAKGRRPSNPMAKKHKKENINQSINSKARKMLYNIKTDDSGNPIINKADYAKFIKLEEADDKDILIRETGVRADKSGMARMSINNAVSYEDFLKIIIDLLTIIAKNSDKMTEIIALLNSRGVNVNPVDVANVGSKSAQARLKDAIRKSGLGRTPSHSGSSNPFGGASDSREPNDIKYVVGLMESLAKS